VPDSILEARAYGDSNEPTLYSRALLINAYNSHCFRTIACAAKRCQTFASQKIYVSCFLVRAVVRCSQQ